MVRLFHPLLNPLNLLNLFTKSSVTHFPQQRTIHETISL